MLRMGKENQKVVYTNYDSTNLEFKFYERTEFEQGEIAIKILKNAKVLAASALVALAAVTQLI